MPKTPRIKQGKNDTDQVIQEILSAMTLQEKLGQLQQIYPDGDVLSDDLAAQIRAGAVGSIFYPGNPELVRQAQQVAVEESRLGIPLIVARDVIHGLRTVFPIPLAQAASWNPKLVGRAAQVAASESRKVGIHWTFAPMVDVSRDPRWGRIAESCGEDPVLSSALGAAMVRGFQGTDGGGTIPGIAACPKHFVGYGLSEGGRDYNRAMVSQSELRNVYLPPFKACVDAGAASLMTAFNTVNGIPASGHTPLLRDLLKQEWGFPGMVVSDWTSISEMITHGYVADTQQAAHYALRAGVDMEMVSTCYRDHAQQLLSENQIQIEMIDEAVRRVLRAKLRLNLFAQPHADDQQPALLNQEHLNVARRLAQQSVVLLKNDNVLPLEQASLKRVAVIGPLADADKDQLGCWVLDAEVQDTVTPFKALLQTLGETVKVTHVPCSPSKYRWGYDEFEDAIKAAQGADVVLLFVGEEQSLSGEAHSRTNLHLPGSQARLVEAMAKLDVPVVMTVLAGRPLTIGKQVDQVDAVLYAWHPGTMGGPALVDLLLGKVSPSGKLPVTFPKAVGQVPLYYNHPKTGRPAAENYRPPGLAKIDDMLGDVRYKSHYIDSDPFPLFPFGFGLSYTQFEYQALTLSDKTLAAGETLSVKVRVANTGDRTATETVQLYTRDLVGSVVRPVQELKQFRRVEIPAGESVVVEFSLAAENLGFFNEQARYAVEPGDFQIMVGGSSQTALSAAFSVEAGPEQIEAEQIEAGRIGADRTTAMRTAAIQTTATQTGLMQTGALETSSLRSVSTGITSLECP
jgi:beta-glucosidase